VSKKLIRESVNNWYRAGQDMVLDKIWHWARYLAGQDIALGKIWRWARYGTGQDIALGKIS
jgi:hypothetical protein